MPRVLTNARASELLGRYGGCYESQALSYGTVQDYCDSCDFIPDLSSRQGDLKDLQRPWVLKAILGRIPIGAELLEIGAGEPLVAQMLSDLGYSVTAVDPYDGSGNGPTAYETYRALYPDVKLVRQLFGVASPVLRPAKFDCIYSISVLEHIHEPALSDLFQGVRLYLKPGGESIHAIDYVVSGKDSIFHGEQLTRIIRHQTELAVSPPNFTGATLSTVISNVIRDDDTYYLSASGHNLWRGTTPYASFPFRKVVSIQSRVQVG